MRFWQQSREYRQCLCLTNTNPHSYGFESYTTSIHQYIQKCAETSENPLLSYSRIRMKWSARKWHRSARNTRNKTPTHSHVCTLRISQKWTSNTNTYIAVGAPYNHVAVPSKHCAHYMEKRLQHTTETHLYWDKYRLVHSYWSAWLREMIPVWIVNTALLCVCVLRRQFFLPSRDILLSNIWAHYKHRT